MAGAPSPEERARSHRASSTGPLVPPPLLTPASRAPAEGPVGSLLGRLGEALTGEKTAQARACYQSAAAVYEECYGPEHEETLDTQQQLRAL